MLSSRHAVYLEEGYAPLMGEKGLCYFAIRDVAVLIEINEIRYIILRCAFDARVLQYCRDGRLVESVRICLCNRPFLFVSWCKNRSSRILWAASIYGV